jgi:hypothetical protein
LLFGVEFGGGKSKDLLLSLAGETSELNSLRTNPDQPTNSVPHPFAGTLANGWETSALNTGPFLGTNRIIGSNRDQSVHLPAHLQRITFLQRTM